MPHAFGRLEAPTINTNICDGLADVILDKRTAQIERTVRELHIFEPGLQFMCQRGPEGDFTVGIKRCHRRTGEFDRYKIKYSSGN